MAGIVISIIELGTMVFVLMILVIGILIAIRMVRRNAPGPAREAYDMETRMIQEIYQDLNKMEERVEALETILLEKERKESSQ